MSHVTVDDRRVIKTFADKHTQTLFLTGKSRQFPPYVAKRVIRKLEYLELATRLEELRVPRGNRLKALRRNRKGQHAIVVDDRLRICFRFDDGGAQEVEVTDRH